MNMHTSLHTPCTEGDRLSEGKVGAAGRNASRSRANAAALLARLPQGMALGVGDESCMLLDDSEAEPSLICRC